MADPQASAATAGKKPRLLQEWQEHLLLNAAVIGAPIGALLYALIAIAYNRFYGELGISPASAGVTRSVIVSHTAIALALQGALVIAVLSVAFGVVAAVAPGVGGARAILIAGLAALVIGPVVLRFTIAEVVLGSDYLGYTLVVVIALASACGASLVWPRIDRRGRRRRALIAIWIAALSISYFAIVRGTETRTAWLATQVRLGHPLPRSGLTLMYDVHADPACISDITQAGTPTRALYLGEAQDWIAYYDIAAARTVRRSRQDLEVRLVPPRRAITCPVTSLP